MTRRELFLYLAPAVLLIALVFAYPIVRTTGVSFFHVNLANGFEPEFAGSSNFTRLAADSRFLDSLVITTLFSIISVSAEFVLGLVLALLATQWVRGQRAIRAILLAPWTLPTAITALLWAWIFNDQYGILSALLQTTGVIGQPIAWLARPATALSAIIVADIWKTTPFVFLVLLAGLQNIPRDLYEAIEIDGGGAWAKFRYVTWPFLLPFVFVSLVFRLIQAFAVFDLVWVMTGGGPGGSTETISVYSYQTFLRYLDIGYGSAQVTVTVLLLAAFAAGLYFVLWRRYARLF